MKIPGAHLPMAVRRSVPTKVGPATQESYVLGHDPRKAPLSAAGIGIRKKQPLRLNSSEAPQKTDLDQFVLKHGFPGLR